MRATIEEGWQRYAIAVEIPVGGVQWEETRKSFYAGSAFLLGQMRILPDDKDVAVRSLEQYQAELRAHIAREKARAGL